MAASKATADFSNPTGRTRARTSAKPTSSKRMPHRDAGARTTRFCPAAFCRSSTNATDHATQQTNSSVRAMIWSMWLIVFADALAPIAMAVCLNWAVDRQRPLEQEPSEPQEPFSKPSPYSSLYWLTISSP